LPARGVKVRFVIANPSTYLYFTDDRPTADGTFRPADEQQFPKFNIWKYGLKDPPRYVQGTPEQIEKTYVAHDVIYLLGTADNDPKLPVLDKSPAAEAQGTDHYSRGLAYARYIKSRHPGLPHQVYEVPDVAHEEGKMFMSAQGLAAIFDVPLPEKK
jgi:hypothetical protein